MRWVFSLSSTLLFCFILSCADQKVEDAKIKVDLESSLPTIASKLFNESKKQKSAIGAIQKLIIKTEKELEKTIEKGENAKQVVT